MDFQLRALALAARAIPQASPNPAVGAVLVSAGQIAGEGFTQPPGGDHAEVVALRQAGETARGAALYVTLEPCCHHGRTPPCTDALVAAGVAEVRMAMEDPSPWVSGRGRAALEAAGIRVVGGGDWAVQAEQLNRPYFKWATRQLPFVSAKYAMTLDGKTATRTGSSRWISGEAARLRVGQMRSQVDAVVVGVETVLADDPQLTARGQDDQLLPYQPARVVLDTRARTPLQARLLAPGPGRPVLIVVGERAESGRLQALESAGAEVVAVPLAGEHLDLAAAFGQLARRQITSTLVESGGRLLAGLVEAGLVDHVAAFVAPKLVGGHEAPTPLEGLGVAEMSRALALDEVTYERVGQDLLITGYLRNDGPAAGG